MYMFDVVVNGNLKLIFYKYDKQDKFIPNAPKI